MSATRTMMEELSRWQRAIARACRRPDDGAVMPGRKRGLSPVIAVVILLALGVWLTPSATAAPTRFYMQDAAADVDPATERGAWNTTSAYLARKLSRTKSGAINTKALAETSTTNDFDVLLLKLVSEPITAAQTISGTLNWVVGARESDILMNAHWHVHVYVMRGTDTLVGTLYTNYTEAAGTNEWPTTAVGDTPTGALTLTSVAIQANDRIVIEAGYVARNTSSTSFTGTLWYGGTGSDLTSGGDETTLAGWWEFSQDLFPLNNFLVEAAGGGSIGTQTAGTPFSIKITARDASNNTATNFTGTVDITSNGTLSAGGGTTANFTAGVLASHSVTFSNTGNFTITATKTAGTEAGTSNAFAVNAPPPFVVGYPFRRLIDITDALVSSGPHTNFPMLFCITLPDLRTTANGGKVTDAQGDDIIFTASDGTTQFAHEVEKYVATTGELLAWVRVPSLASTSQIYLNYGNSSVTTFQGNVTSNGVTGVWDANFMGVWHLNEATNTTRLDSTSNNNDLADATNTAAATGKVGGAAVFATDWLTISDAAQTGLDLGTQYTLEAWAQSPTSSGNKSVFSKYENSTNNRSYVMRWSSDRHSLLSSFDGNIVETNNASDTLSINTWYHLVIVYDSPNALFYRDGTYKNTSATSGGAPFNGTGPFNIGSRSDGTTQAFDGTIDEVRVSNGIRSADWIKTEYNNQSACAGFFTVGAEEQVVIGAFNAYETSTAVGAIYGFIKTKIAGATVSFDIIKVNAAKTAIDTTFANTVKVELLDASNNTGALDANACRSTWTTVIQTLPNEAIAVNGRKTVASFTQANSYRDVRIRVSYPTSSPTAIGCSTDNFAIRPNTLASFAVTDTDWQTVGTGRALDNVSFGPVIHKAGQPFTVSATAVNTAPVTTTNYTGAPTATLTACGSAACTATFGTFTLGASFAAGVLTSNAATYNNVGSFNLQLIDSTFANVDASDGSTTTERNITSGTPISVGRFVPDHFAVALNTPVFGSACGSFTYIGQVFNYATAPVITVTAQDSANNTTTLYADPTKWWRITNASLTGKAYTWAVGTLNTSGITGTDPVIDSTIPGAGVGTLTFSSGTGGLLFTRSTPVAFDADISLAINVIDADGVTYASNPARFGAATAGNGIAFSGGKPMRFGRLALGNALGSEVLNLPIPIQTQYWNGTSFVTNTLDSCTTITASNIVLSNYQGALTSGNLPSGNISTGGTFNAGIGNLKLTKPSSAVNGSVDLCVDLGGDATCVATPAGMSYLQGVWSGTTYTLDPRARAAFGFSKGSYSGGGRDPFVYQRENY